MSRVREENENRERLYVNLLHKLAPYKKIYYERPVPQCMLT
jgi:hypothetical protein